MISILRRFEDVVASLPLVIMVALPIAEIVARLFSSSVPGAAPIVQHLTLWVCFLGSALAAREGMLLTFATRDLVTGVRARTLAHVIASSVAAGVASLLAVAGFQLVRIDRDAGNLVTQGLPVWVTLIVLPVAFALIAIRLAWKTEGGWIGRGISAVGVVAGVVLALNVDILDGRPGWPALVIVLIGTLAGGPIFAALGGVAAFLFMSEGVPPMAVLAETYRLNVYPTLPAIPLFTLVGFLLAEGTASRRLLRFFRAFFGWMPGGTAIVCALLCAFFTIPTGGSGVTILALGGLLYQALRQDGYRERFSLGLLTGSGSLGLLFAPALPLILYAIVARVPVDDLFIAGAVPGILLVLLVALWGVRTGNSTGVTRTPFDAREAAAAAWSAKWELFLPVVALAAIFGGFATLVEASALTAVYTFLIQTVVHRDVSIRRDLLRVFQQCVVLVGGVLLILGVAMGFSNYVVDIELPSRMLDWVQEHVHSPLLFLLCLNLFLLVVGCLMDIFSATVVVVPLILPMGLAFGIDPIHLGIIFVANLELGFLTPPVGLNLFFAAYRFEKPLLEVYRAAVPMLIILGIGVLVITYVPGLSTGLLELLGR